MRVAGTPDIEERIRRFDQKLLEGLSGAGDTLMVLQTIPGVDLIGAAMLLVEIGTDMSVVGHEKLTPGSSPFRNSNVIPSLA